MSQPPITLSPIVTETVAEEEDEEEEERQEQEQDWPLRPDSPIDIGIITLDRRTPDSLAATLTHLHHHRTSTPVTVNFDRHATPDSVAAAKRSRRSSITNSGDFSIGNFSFEQLPFPFQGELREKLEEHVSGRRSALVEEPSLAEDDESGEEEEEDGDDDEDDASIYPDTTSLVLILVALCLAVFCMCLDMTIISTAIPRITDDFKAIDDVGWYASSYMLTLSAFQLFYGKLYSLFSTKRIFVMALFWFEVGSAICGAAPTSVALIVGRAIAGFGSAGLFSGALLIIAASAPLRKRPTYIGIVGSMYGIASVTGPLMGGAFTDKLSWRWCFYINLPIGAVTVLFIIFFYREQPRARALDEGWKARFSQFDVEGLMIFLPTVVCLLLALQWGGTKYQWSDGRVIALLVLFGGMLLVFMCIQFCKKDKATVPVRVLRQRSIAASAWLAFTLGASFFVFTYYIPIWFQAIQSASPVQSGIRNIPMVLSVVISSVPTGVAVTYVGYYTPFAILSSILLSIGAGLTTTWTTDTGSSQWIGYQVILGLGVGFGFQQTMLAAQTCLPKQDVPIGTAIVVFFQTLGGAIVVSVANNIFSRKLLTGIVQVVPELDLPAVLRVYNGALVGTFYVGTALATLSIVGSAALEWKSVKGADVHVVAA